MIVSHIAAILPKEAPTCSYAYANVKGERSYFNGKFIDADQKITEYWDAFTLLTILHEWGHNMNLRHSSLESTPTDEYQDRYVFVFGM
jgi:hypothetical protein